MKKLSILLAALLCACLLVGCIGTPVIYQCNCPKDDPDAGMPDDGLKTGLAFISSIRGSASADGTTNGKADYDITVAAVLVDKDGVIRDCIIDCVATSVGFDNAGQLTTDITQTPMTKRELGDNYLMPSGSWKSQTEAIAAFAIGKTAAQFKGAAVDSTGHAADADLATSATFYIGGCVNAVEAAAKAATYRGAKTGDTLKLAATTSLSSSKAAAGEAAGLSQLDVDVTAITMKEGVITSCVIDAVQAKVEFNATGAITTDLTKPVKTKGELGRDYGMVDYAGAKYEWNEQAASFAKYVTGKTPAQVAGIAVDSGSKPIDADLSASVTIAIGGFQALLAKAAQ